MGGKFLELLSEIAPGLKRAAAAERMRRHRQRRLDGLRSLTIELRETEVDSHRRLAAVNRNRRHRGRRVGVSASTPRGLDIGFTTGGALAWAGGSGRTFALQPVSLEGLVGLNVALGVSALKLGAPR
jgi:hypothetical protein